MSEHFGSAALRLGGLAARALGWRPAEFWAATPAELAAALGVTGELEPGTGLDRQILQRLMDTDHER